MCDKVDEAFCYADEDRRNWTPFTDGDKEQGSVGRGDAVSRSVSKRRVAFYMFALVAAVCGLIVILVCFLGIATGFAHTLGISATASTIYTDEVAVRGAGGGVVNTLGHAEAHGVVKRALGWTWWNGVQFGAWIGLGTLLLGNPVGVAGSAAAWASGVGGILCYLIAIAGGAGVNQRDVSFNLLHVNNGSVGGMVAFELMPVDLPSVKQNWTLPKDLNWHKVLDDRAANTYLASDSDGRGHHAIVSISPTQNTKRNSENDFDDFDGNGDYVYGYLMAGNSAREYWYDHSLSDWDNYMPGLQYWLIDGDGTNTYQQFCMVPQDSQGNAVAAIAVQTNFNSYNDALNCMNAAEEANGSFDPN
jgi:hypothetical protein